MVEKYKDFYGCTAKINRQSDGTCKLVIKTSQGKTIKNTTYNSYKGAKIAMGKSSNAWGKVL